MEDVDMPAATDTRTKTHADGEKKYTQCNLAENHAGENPGHSLTVIANWEINGMVLRIVCFGDVDAYLQGTRNCDFETAVPLS